MASAERGVKIMDLDEEKRRTELAYFCLSRVRKVLRHANNLMIQDDTISEIALFESSAEMEDLIIALHHVHESCRLLKNAWPSWVTAGLRDATARFIKAWRRADGQNLRHAYSHYEEAIVQRDHPRRNDAVNESTVWHKVEYRFLKAEQEYEPTPHAVTLLGITYSIDGVYAAAVYLEQELRDVIAPIASRVTVSEGDREQRWSLESLGVHGPGNYGVVQDHSHLGGGIDWDRKNEIDAARADSTTP